MSTSKKILLYVGMILAVVTLVLAAAGIIGAWYYNTPVTETVLSILVPVTNTLQRVETIAGETVTALEDVSTGLVEAQRRVEEIGADVNEANLAVEAISTLVGEDIRPKIDQIRKSYRSVYDTLAAIQEVVRAVNALPFLDLELPGDEELEQARTGMEDIGAEVQALNTKLTDRKAEIVGGAVEQVNDPLDRLGTNVTETKVKIAGIETSAKESKENLLYVQENVASWIDLASIAMTLVLIWIIISQVAVFLLCREYLQGEAAA